MTEPEHRTIAQILGALQETFSSFGGVLAELEPPEWHLPTGCPGWDVQDVASHIIGLEYQLAGHPDPVHTLSPDLPHVRHDDARGLEVHVDYRRGEATEEMLRQFRDATTIGMEIRQASTRAADELTDGPFGWRMPYWQLLSIRTFDVFAHEQDVRRAVARPGNLDGSAAAVTGDLIVGFLSGLLPNRVERLVTEDVVIEVGTGGGAAGRQIVVGARDRLRAPERDAPPTASITMGFGELVAFTCGRADVGEDQVTMRGDVALAAEVLKAMVVTP
jgi:uncharacterized protein (TIGR03083 family)